MNDGVYKFFFNKRKYGVVGHINFLGKRADVTINKKACVFVGKKRVYASIPCFDSYSVEYVEKFIRAIPAYLGMRSWINIIKEELK